MLIACWAAKGGSGTTVVSVALAAILARSSPAGALLADLDGDVPAVLGLPEASGPGLAEWLAAGADVPADALSRLEVAGPGGLRVLLPGTSDAGGRADAGGAAVEGAIGVGGRADRAEVLAAVLAADGRPVVADCGSGPRGAGLVLAASAPVSLLVLRPCYLALRRALAAPVRPSGVVLVRERERAIGTVDVEDALGVAVRAVVDVEAAVARAVDAGLLAGRVPRGLARALRHAA